MVSRNRLVAGMEQPRDRSTQQIQDNIRALQNDINNLRSQITMTPSTTTKETGNNFLTRRVEQLEWRLDHLKIKAEEAEAGDTYQGFFKVTQKEGEALTVTVGSGYFVDARKSYLYVSSANVVVSSSPGVHGISAKIVYTEATNSFAVSFIDSGASQDYNIGGNTQYILLAEVVVVNGVISAGPTQKHFGFLQYFFPTEQFAVTISSEYYVRYNSGRFIAGSTVVNIPSGTLLAYDNETVYVYLESEYDSGLSVSIKASTNYPTQTYAMERILIATVFTHAEYGLPLSIRQETLGDIRSTRLWP